MIICYSGRSKPSALAIAEAGGFQVTRSSRGSVNWGRRVANTELNSDISNSVNKRVMRELFASHDVPMPKLVNEETIVEVNLDGTLPRIYIGRPDNHSRGRGLWYIKTIGDFHRATRGTRRKKAATHFMEYIDAPREYRVHIFKGKSIRISEKTFGDFEGRKYITTKPKHNIKHVRKAAKQAVQALGLDFGAVDVLADDNNCWVLEVNAAPGLGGSLPRLYAETFKRWERGEL